MGMHDVVKQHCSSSLLVYSGHFTIIN